MMLIMHRYCPNLLLDITFMCRNPVMYTVNCYCGILAAVSNLHEWAILAMVLAKIFQENCQIMGQNDIQFSPFLWFTAVTSVFR